MPSTRQSVEDHLRRFVGETGRVDVSFNAVGLGYVIGVPLSEASVDKFAASDAPGVDYAMTVSAERAGISRQAFEEQIAQQTLLKRLPRLSEIGAAAALMASDHASAVTAAVMNVTCGGVMD